MSTNFTLIKTRSFQNSTLIAGELAINTPNFNILVMFIAKQTSLKNGLLTAINFITANDEKKLAYNRNNIIMENISNFANFEEKPDFANSEHGNKNSEEKAIVEK